MAKERVWPNAERRSHPRVNADLRGEVITPAQAGSPLMVRGKNISRVGVHCHVNRYIPPFQKLHLSMIIPLKQNGRVHNEVIQIEGVTVRVEPETEDPDVLDYHVAIYFENLKEEDAEIISAYVEQKKPELGD